MQRSPQASSSPTPGSAPVTDDDHTSYVIPQRVGFMQRFTDPVTQEATAAPPRHSPASWSAMAPGDLPQVTTCEGGELAATMPQQRTGWRKPAPCPPPPPSPPQQTSSGGWASSSGWSQPQQTLFGQQMTRFSTPNQWSPPGPATHCGERRGARDQRQSSPQWQGRSANSTTMQRCKKPGGQCGQRCSLNVDAMGRHENGALFCPCERHHHLRA